MLLLSLFSKHDISLISLPAKVKENQQQILTQEFGYRWTSTILDTVIVVA
jgi:hypothetical protein